MNLVSLQHVDLLENLVLRIDCSATSVTIVTVGVGAAVESALAGARNVHNLHRTFTRISLLNVLTFEARPGMLKLSPRLTHRGFCATPGAPIPVVQGFDIRPASERQTFELRMGTFGAVAVEFEGCVVDEKRAKGIESKGSWIYVDIATGKRFDFYDAFAS